MAWDFNDKPILVFWETTKACGLACRHCRASAISEPLPDELTHEEGIALLDQVADFGTPSPVLVLTGGDVLQRRRLFDLIAHARERGIHVAVSPSVTPLLTQEMIQRLAGAGVESMSLSLDSADAAGHDDLRGVPGTRNRTLNLLAFAADCGLKVQINTTVMAWNVEQLPTILHQILGLGACAWEVFFLIHEGRGSQLTAPTPQQCEAACVFLREAATYGMVVRTVEGPFYRRVVAGAAVEGDPDVDALADDLISDLRFQLGPSPKRPLVRGASTRDGKGIVFVSYRGDVAPSGFLPVVGGSVREQPLAEIYRHSDLFRTLRDGGALRGRCRICAYRELCGGSRARAFSASRDWLAEDPACAWQPTAPLQPARTG